MSIDSTNDTPFYKRTVKEIIDIERPAREFAISRGWLFEKVVSNSRRGWPDRFCARKGRVLLAEFKKPGKEPTKQQFERHEELRKFGIEVHWIDNLRAAYDLFR